MNIVFAHFNSSIPKYLIENLNRTAETFEQMKVHIITNLQLKKAQIPKIQVFHHSINDDWITLENLLAHPKHFRNNFSFTSIARFLAIADFSDQVPGEILHVESDVILSEDFPFSLLTKKGRQIACPLVNEDLAIASVLYLRNRSSTQILRNYTLDSARRNPFTTDMHILREISKTEGDIFQSLPTVPSINEVLPDVSQEFLMENAEAVAEFQNLFDGGDLGRYLFGDDPRNWGGRPPIRHNPSITYFDIRNLSFTIDESRNFPYVNHHEIGLKIPIQALHIHSKQNRIFKASKQARLIHKAVNKSSHPMRSQFYLKYFLLSKYQQLKKLFNIRNLFEQNES